MPQGASKAEPDQVKLSEEELKELIESARGQLGEGEGEGEGEEVGIGSDGEWVDMESGSDVEEEEAKTKSSGSSSATKSAPGRGVAAASGNDELAMYNFDAYDEEGGDVQGVAMSGAGMNGLAGLTYHSSNATDPYITLKEKDAEDEEDFSVGPSDNLLVLGRTEDMMSHIEVHLWNTETGTSYVHHDLMLQSYPLCTEWLDFDCGDEAQAGNFIAVGTMDPVVEIWDLDVIDAPEPAFVLGDRSAKAPTSKGIRGSGSGTDSGAVPSHTAEVLGLGWNRMQRNLLASASADKTVRLWDLSCGACLRTYTHHDGKVQNVTWNPAEKAVLLTGSFDKSACAFDTRDPSAVARWNFSADVAGAAWNVHNASMFVAATDDGFVYGCDARHPGEPVWTLQAHDSPITCMALSPGLSGCMATADFEGNLKLWDISDNQPNLVHGRELNTGPVYCAQFAPDSPFVLAAGGHLRGLKVIDLAQNASGKSEKEREGVGGNNDYVYLFFFVCFWSIYMLLHPFPVPPRTVTI